MTVDRSAAGNEKWKAWRRDWARDLRRNKAIYIMFIPVFVYFIVFSYIPIIGAQIAFRNFRAVDGIWGSTWVGLEHFRNFLSNFYFWRLIRNTLLINFYDILFGFPAPIILALLINEIRNKFIRRVTQTVSYLPHFVSIVVVAGLVRNFFSGSGIINDVLISVGIFEQPLRFMTEQGWFRPLFVGSQIWQTAGLGSIIYLAALTSIDQELYEAASIDGAKRMRQLWHITLPGIMPTILIMFILRVGSIMTVGFERVLLLYNENVYETADVISTFVYRQGILLGNFSYTTAVDLFNSIINLTVLLLVNKFCRKRFEQSLW